MNSPDPSDVPTAPATLAPADAAARVAELEAGIRWVVTQEADDLCWMDAYTCLSRLVGVTFDPLLIPPEDMKANCHRFVDALHAGCPYGADRLTVELARLRAALARIRDECGQVCPDFMECDHPACASSYGAYVIAAEALEGTHERR